MTLKFESRRSSYQWRSDKKIAFSTIWDVFLLHIKISTPYYLVGFDGDKNCYTLHHKSQCFLRADCGLPLSFNVDLSSYGPTSCSSLLQPHSSFYGPLTNHQQVVRRVVGCCVLHIFLFILLRFKHRCCKLSYSVFRIIHLSAGSVRKGFLTFWVLHCDI